jgi:hypothetical protein
MLGSVQGRLDAAPPDSLGARAPAKSIEAVPPRTKTNGKSLLQ